MLLLVYHPFGSSFWFFRPRSEIDIIKTGRSILTQALEFSKALFFAGFAARNKSVFMPLVSKIIFWYDEGITN